MDMHMHSLPRPVLSPKELIYDIFFLSPLGLGLAIVLVDISRGDSHIILLSKELICDIVFLRPLGLRLIMSGMLFHLMA